MTSPADVLTFCKRLNEIGQARDWSLEARATLATWRRAASLTDFDLATAWGLVLQRLLPAHADLQRQWDITDSWEASVLAMVAALYALHPEQRLPPTDRDDHPLRRSHNLGDVFRAMEQRDPIGQAEEAGERRFVALLNAGQAALPYHLRHAVRLAASRDQLIRINYYELVLDLFDWPDPEARHETRLQWAHHYYTRRSFHDDATDPLADPTADTSDSSPNENAEANQE